MFETMMENFSNCVSKAEAKVEVRKFKEHYEDDLKLLQMLSDAFNEVSQHKEAVTVMDDIFDISRTFDSICKIGNITSTEDKEKVMAELTFMYSQTGYQKLLSNEGLKQLVLFSLLL